MPFDLLQRLLRADLPVSVQDPSEIEKVLILHAAGMIVANIPMPVLIGGGYAYAHAAEIVAITAQGVAAARPRRP